MKQQINIAVIGLGRLGTIHTENIINNINSAKLYYVIDAMEERVKNVAKLFNIPKHSTNPLDALTDPDVDAVIITTPTQTHGNLIIEAAKYKKHIFVEKPITETLTEAEKVIQLIKSENILCQVGFMRRFHPAYVEAYNRIKNGEIGKPIHIKSFTRDNPPGKFDISPQIEFLKTSGGIFLDLAIHDYDIARFLMGSDIESVFSTGKVVMNPFMNEYGDVDQAITFLEFSSGATGEVESSRNSPYGFDIGTEIIGTEGAIQIPTIREKETILLNVNGKNEPSPIFPPSMIECYKNEITHFIYSIQNKLPSACSEYDGLEALKVATAATNSFKSEKKVRI